MKKLHPYKYPAYLLFVLLMLSFSIAAKAQGDSVEKQHLVKLHYYNVNNSMQYLLLETVLKTGKKIEPEKNIPLQLFLDSANAENLIAKLSTNEEGKAKAFIPPGLKTGWMNNAKHTFVVVPDYGSKEKASPSEFEINKARIQLDTSSADGVKTITVKVEQYDGTNWTPAKDVEMKVGIQRLGGILTAGEAETYTTDSSGTVSVEVKKDSLPGDTKGNILLQARVDDNELFGNLVTEKSVPWGVPTVIKTDFFDHRSLWGTRFRTPLWLLALAYTIVIGVWGTLIYLIVQLIKIRKLGKKEVTPAGS